MADQERWKSELEGYIRQGEPEQAEKSLAWQTAIGLQKVDGLKTSEYLLDTAKAHIEGSIDIAGVQHRIESYYEALDNRRIADAETKEADIVSTRITALLGERTFQFSPVELQSIHRQLFSGLFAHAGSFRNYNISKKEWVLNGESVYYASHESIQDTLDYDFRQEKQFSYAGLSVPDAIRHLAQFTAGIWQIHPFAEGNTRTTAVFVLKYLRTFGFQVNNDVFAEHSWYFRNALVRANHHNLQKGIHATKDYLVMFFENLLMGTSHPLKNRMLHVDYRAKASVESAADDNSKCKICTLNCTLEELAVLYAISSDAKITQKSLASQLGLSERTIKNITVSLQDKGFLRRVNGKRNGFWEVLSELPDLQTDRLLANIPPKI